MHVLQGAGQRVALSAQPGNLLGELEGLFAFLGMRSKERLVARIAGLCRRVDIFGLQHAHVACRGHAAFNRRGGPVGKGKAQGKQGQ